MLLCIFAVRSSPDCTAKIRAERAKGRVYELLFRGYKELIPIYDDLDPKNVPGL